MKFEVTAESIERYGIHANPGSPEVRVYRTDLLRKDGYTADDIIEAKPAIFAFFQEKFEADVAQEMADALTKRYEYRIHDDTASGIYNGFYVYDFRRLIEHILEDIEYWRLRSDLVYDESILRDVKRLMDERFLAEAQEIYEPYPIHEGWSGEYKDACLKAIANRTAAGECSFPADQVLAALRDVLAEVLPEHIRQYRKSAESIIIRSGAYRQYTGEEAEAAMHSYNAIVNEGGEGYVPHIYNTVEVESAAQMVAACDKYLRGVQHG